MATNQNNGPKKDSKDKPVTKSTQRTNADKSKKSPHKK